MENNKIVLALGLFDGVHLGHRLLLEKAKALAKENNCSSAVLSFLGNPFSVLGKSTRLIYSDYEKEKIFTALQIDKIIKINFTKEFSLLKPEEFISKALAPLDIFAIVVGEDFSFGFNKAGDVSLLKEYYEIKAIRTVSENQRKISSSDIRELLFCDIIKANALLGANYFILARVVKGKGRGKIHGFPTANVLPSKHKLLPKEGVYKTITTIDGKNYSSCTHIGLKPTFLDNNKTVETIIKNYSGILYDKEIKIEFVSFLRRNEKFCSAEKLKQQIERDLM